MSEVRGEVEVSGTDEAEIFNEPIEVQISR